MDARYQAWKRLEPAKKDDGKAMSVADAERIGTLMREGSVSEFWLILKDQIEALIHDVESHFVEQDAKDYADYKYWLGLRKAYLTVVNTPFRLIEQAERSLRDNEDSTGGGYDATRHGTNRATRKP